jgi:hypothetical protein
MDVAIDHEASQRSVGIEKLTLIGVGHGSAPEISRPRVEDREPVMLPFGGKAPQPVDPVGAKHRRGRRGKLLKGNPKEREKFRRFCDLLRESIGPPVEFVRVAYDAGPAQSADHIDNLSRAGAGLRQVSAMDDLIGRDLVEIGDNGFQGRQAPVDIGNDHNAGCHNRQLRERKG